jgi:hypothetical protein
LTLDVEREWNEVDNAEKEKREKDCVEFEVEDPASFIISILVILLLEGQKLFPLHPIQKHSFFLSNQIPSNRLLNLI